MLTNNCQVLTRSGFIPVDRLTTLDLIYVVDRYGIGRFDRARNISSFKYTGDLVSIINYDVDIQVTPEHKIPLVNRNSNNPIKYVSEKAIDMLLSNNFIESYTLGMFSDLVNNARVHRVRLTNRHPLYHLGVCLTKDFDTYKNKDVEELWDTYQLSEPNNYCEILSRLDSLDFSELLRGISKIPEPYETLTIASEYSTLPKMLEMAAIYNGFRPVYKKSINRHKHFILSMNTRTKSIVTTDQITQNTYEGEVFEIDLEQHKYLTVKSNDKISLL